MKGPGEQLGDPERRSRLLFIFWVISVIMTAAGFVIMVWILYNGGL
jgi:hypothetical protein